MKTRFNIVSLLIVLGFLALGAGLSFVIYGALYPLVVVPLAALGALLGLGVQVVDQWEAAIILRLGKFYAVKGPGIFWIILFSTKSPTLSISAQSPRILRPSKP